MIAGHAASTAPWTTTDTIWFVVVSMVLGGALLAASRRRVRRARRSVECALRQAGYQIVRLKYRFLRWGPYAWTTNQSGQIVYRVTVKEPGGRERHGWARWGRPWFWMPDALELKWDDPLAKS